MKTINGKIRCTFSKENNTEKIHVAIVDSHTANLIINGKKQIETRFSINKIIPYGRINEGDKILIKKSGGPVVATARAERVCFYTNLDSSAIDELRIKYNDFIQADEDYWKRKNSAKYATFIYLSDIEPIEPFWLSKKDRLGWRIYSNNELSKIIPKNQFKTLNRPFINV